MYGLGEYNLGSEEEIFTWIEPLAS